MFFSKLASWLVFVNSNSFICTFMYGMHFMNSTCIHMCMLHIHISRVRQQPATGLGTSILNLHVCQAFAENDPDVYLTQAYSWQLSSPTLAMFLKTRCAITVSSTPTAVSKLPQLSFLMILASKSGNSYWTVNTLWCSHAPMTSVLNDSGIEEREFILDCPHSSMLTHKWHAAR